jgi:hypothetical protein
MSEVGGRYYRERAEALGVVVPSLLLGAPVPLFNPESSVNHADLEERLAGHFLAAEHFALEGVRAVLAAYGRNLSNEEWCCVRALPRYSRVCTAPEYASEVAAPALRRALFARGDIWLEAVAPTEIAESCMKRATVGCHVPRLSKEEASEVFLLARILSPNRLTCFAYLTLIWVDHRLSHRQANRGGSLTPRYFGAPLRRGERQRLQPWTRH